MKEIRVLSETERNWAMFCHLAAFAGFFVPFGGIIGPLVIWLSKKDESTWINENGKASLNFQLSMLLYMILVLPLCFIIIGFPLLAVLWLLKIIFIIIASVRASKGEEFRYPLAIPFIQ
ncbi:MAG TPA: DUF4870 domain-containing protein [Bacteroidales bacterium]|nr:DUF4870 domain-containing protein [Bacteroidales bacterium]